MFARSAAVRVDCDATAEAEEVEDAVEADVVEADVVEATVDAAVDAAVISVAEDVDTFAAEVFALCPL